MLFVDKAPHIIDTGDSDGEESLSLCDLPIMPPLKLSRPHIPRERRLPPSPSSELFEFIHDLGAEMCSAEDIFLRGQLLPHKFKPSPLPSPLPTTPPLQSAREKHAHEGSRRSSSNRRSSRHVKSESFDGFERSRRGDGPATQCWRGRGSLSANYQKLWKVADAPLNRIESRVKRCDGSVSAPSRPKWYMVAFGTMRLPGAMEMKDLKSRQRRQNAPASSPSFDGRSTASVSGGSGPWWLLRSLSCKGDVDGVIQAPDNFCMT